MKRRNQVKTGTAAARMTEILFGNGEMSHCSGTSSSSVGCRRCGTDSAGSVPTSSESVLGQRASLASEVFVGLPEGSCPLDKAVDSGAAGIVEAVELNREAQCAVLAAGNSPLVEGDVARPPAGVSSDGTASRWSDILCHKVISAVVAAALLRSDGAWQPNLKALHRPGCWSGAPAPRWSGGSRAPFGARIFESSALARPSKVLWSKRAHTP